MITIKLSILQEHLLNAHVQNHVEKCHEFLEYENDCMLDGFEPFAPYCGCDDCRTRETLHAAFDWFEKQGILKLEPDDSN